MDTSADEPLTPAGRMFVQPEMNQVINCGIGLKNRPDIDAIKSEITSSVMLKQPRFNSLLVIDSHGREHWRRTQVDVDRHIIVRNEPITDDVPTISQEDAVNDYLADLSVSSPLSTDKPLWEVHLLMAHNCLVLRLHHALGDGISLMSMFFTCCRRADDPTQTPTIGGLGTSSASSGGQRRPWWAALGRAMMVVWYTLVFAVEFMLRSLWLKDKKTAVSGGAGVELWPRKLATAKFKLDDMKAVKKAVSQATINDVLFGVVSCGFSRYLDIRSPKALQDGIQITGLSMVNLRPQAGLQDYSKLSDSKSSTRFGNQFGMLLLPVYYHKQVSDPLQVVRRAKAMIDKKKLSLEALLSYKIGDFVMSCFGAKAISMHMVSYAGRADMQILAAKDIIPDPQLLAKCFEDALLEMKEFAEEANKTRGEKEY